MLDIPFLSSLLGFSQEPQPTDTTQLEYVGCPQYVPENENAPIFGCSSFYECSAKFSESTWFGTQEQYFSDDFSRALIITAAEMSSYSYKFKNTTQRSSIYRNDNSKYNNSIIGEPMKKTTNASIELVNVRLMYRKRLYEQPKTNEILPDDKTLEEYFTDVYGDRNSQAALENVYEDDKSRAIGFIGVLRFNYNDVVEKKTYSEKAGGGFWETDTKSKEGQHRYIENVRPHQISLY